MSRPSAISLLWIVAPLCALAFLFRVDEVRLERAEFLSALPGRAERFGVIDPSSPTGYPHGQRELILPVRNEDSFQWITQTQQMFARGQWRVRHVDYDNAPKGIEVTATSPYRWWLGAMADLDRAFSGRPIGLSVERAAFFADPVLHGLLLIAGSAFVAWRFGILAAALFSLGVAVIFPFSAVLVPAVPDHHNLARACALAALLVLLAGMAGLEPAADPAAAERVRRRARRWFAAAGILGGLGLWVHVPTEVPLLIGTVLGALLAAWCGRSAARAAAFPLPPWRVWAWAGGLTTIAAWLAEFAPAHLGSWRLESVHPLYGLAWIGAGEFLARAVAGIRGGKAWKIADLAAAALGLAAVAAVPVAMKLADSHGFLAPDTLSVRLDSLPEGPNVASSWAWLVRDGVTGATVASWLPLLLAAAALALILRRATPPGLRSVLALGLGPAAVALAFACRYLGWWGTLDCALLPLLAAGAGRRRLGPSWWNRGLWSALTAAFVIPGAIQLWPQRDAGKTLSTEQTEEMIERDLAHWLAKHAGEDGAVVYAPPNESTTLAFYGGLRGIGTYNRDDEAGLGVTLMIADATTIQEAQLLLTGRDVRYLVLPSWDPFFDDYTKLYLAKNFNNWQGFFIPALRRYELPDWLRGVVYQMPKIGGFENQMVLVFEMAPNQSPAAALSREAEYLVEMGQMGAAATAEQVLRRYPADIGALAARAQVEAARGDVAAFQETLNSLLTRLSYHGDRFLPWDRRVSLAIVLARARRNDLAREQLRRCLATVNEQRLRSLSTSSLYLLIVLERLYGLPMPDPRLRELALDLLPETLRNRF